MKFCNRPPSRAQPGGAPLPEARCVGQERRTPSRPVRGGGLRFSIVCWHHHTPPRSSRRARGPAARALCRAPGLGRRAVSSEALISSLSKKLAVGAADCASLRPVFGPDDAPLLPGASERRGRLPLAAAIAGEGAARPPMRGGAAAAAARRALGGGVSSVVDLWLRALPDRGRIILLVVEAPCAEGGAVRRESDFASSVSKRAHQPAPF